jgi:hypothetical protein
MNPWICVLLIGLAGACGGFVNSLVSDNGFLVPRWEHGVLCPGALSNILVGAFAALASWAFYGAGAGVEVTDLVSERGQVSLRLSALAAALLVGVGGAKWLTGEADKQLLKESIKSVGAKSLSPEDCERLVQGSPRRVLRRIKHT